MPFSPRSWMRYGVPAGGLLDYPDARAQCQRERYTAVHHGFNARRRGQVKPAGNFTIGMWSQLSALLAPSCYLGQKRFDRLPENRCVREPSEHAHSSRPLQTRQSGRGQRGREFLGEENFARGEGAWLRGRYCKRTAVVASRRAARGILLLRETVEHGWRGLLVCSM